MVADALQIPYNQDDYDLYKNWTGDSRTRQLGYLFALYKVVCDGHIQCVISGEFGKGKTSTGTAIAKYDTKYTRRLLKLRKPELYMTSDIHLRVKDNIIISPLDPASKYIKDPKRWNAYLIDEAYLFATTQEANTVPTRKIRNRIMRNRKRNVSNYWIYPNIFKCPSLILELMDIWVHKESVQVGDVIIPNTVIQHKEKFDRDRVEKYAKMPRYFRRLIRHHPSFIAKVRFPRIRGRGWDEYLLKYDEYSIDEDEDRVKANVKMDLFRQIDEIMQKQVVQIKSAKDRQEFVYRLILKTLMKKSKDETSSSQRASTFTDQYLRWEEERVATELTKGLSTALVENTDLDTELEDDGKGG